MSAEIWKWLLGVASSAGLVGFVGYLMRDTAAKLFSKAVEHRFERKLETFKAEIRANEKELDQIRSFLISARKERDSILQLKRLEAAETLLRARYALSQLSVLVEYMQVLNTEVILNRGDDPKITEFIETLVRPLDIDEKLKVIGSVDKTTALLYISDKSLQAFNAYQRIIVQATMMMRLFRFPMRDKGKFLKPGSAGKLVMELVPASKEGFDQWGEDYAYHWSAYFYDEILRSLRQEVSGVADLTKDTESIEQVALDSRRVQMNIRSTVENAGLPNDLLRSAETVAASAAVVAKVSS
jgi:hypothetical protein